MTMFDFRGMRRRIDWLLRDESVASTNRAGRPALPVLVLIAMMIYAWTGSPSFAVAQPEGARSVPGSVMPSTGTTAGTSVSPQTRTSLASSSNAGSLNGPVERDARCANLRKRYARSEACFARYRMKNHGLRPGAFQQCKQLKDPSVECGSAVVP